MSPSPREQPTVAVGITETLLKSYISNAQISVPGYNVVRSDRKTKVGGGCILYVNDAVTITKESSWSDNQTSVAVAYAEEQNLLMACLYRPPDAAHSSFSDAMKLTPSLKKQSKYLRSS